MVPIGLLRPIKDYLRRSGRIELAELVKLVDQAELCHHDTHVHKKGAQKNLRDQALEIIAQVSDAPPSAQLVPVRRDSVLTHPHRGTVLSDRLAGAQDLLGQLVLAGLQCLNSFKDCAPFFPLASAAAWRAKGRWLEIGKSTGGH